MSPTEKFQGWFRLTWPILALLIIQGGAGVNAYYNLKSKVDTHIAVDTQDAEHTKETMEEIKGDVKEIMRILTKP